MHFLKTTFAKATVVKAGCSAARLAHLVWDQRVAGSNPATPTKEKALHESAGLFCMNKAWARPKPWTDKKDR